MCPSELEEMRAIVARMKAEAALCIKCKENPRQGSQRWCRGCRAAYRVVGSECANTRCQRELGKADRVYCSSACRYEQEVRIRFENSEEVSAHTLRTYLKRTRPHQCEVCGGVEWMGKPIPLEVDHINGNSFDNSESNLRRICLNCHAQTPTWKAKNRGNGRILGSLHVKQEGPYGPDQVCARLEGQEADGRGLR